MNNFEMLKKEVVEFEKKINYVFKDRENILLAFTHSSYANENKNEKLKSNERLEFLGDAILNIVVSEHIYRTFPQLAEGDMTRVRASVVCEQTLVKCSNNIEAGRFLILGKGEELTGGRTRISILSDAFEAVIGAIYIDGGMEKARHFIYNQMKQVIDDAVGGLIFMDYKTQLQELAQKRNESKVVYEVIREHGPDHNKMFVSQVRIGDRIMGKGEGRSKKEAEQKAAKSALEKKI